MANHRRVSRAFLDHLDGRRVPLRTVQAKDIEVFVTQAGKRLCRGTLQHEIAALRGLLRFLALDGKVPPGLDKQIDTPRLYRLEQLPRALPWPTVIELLKSLDLTSDIGLRDYAMFLLIATYGLRASEVVELTLDDVAWRKGVLRIHQRKTSLPLELPLTNEVATALTRHLKHSAPPAPYRRIFLRKRAPIGVLKPTAVTEAFQALVRHSKLDIPFQGPHCLRHSLAVHLLKNGTPLKTIGDILGHRTAESTSNVPTLGHRRFAGCPASSSRQRSCGQGGALVTTTPLFSSALTPIFEQYVNLKRSLGRRFTTATWTLQSLDRFLGDHAGTYKDLTQTVPMYAVTRSPVWLPGMTTRMMPLSSRWRPITQRMADALRLVQKPFPAPVPAIEFASVRERIAKTPPSGSAESGAPGWRW